jgi:hypothetical protein
VKFGHAVSHCQCSKICLKLPKSIQIYLETISSWNFEIPPKIEILVLSKKMTSMCRRGTKAWAHCLDFQSKNFPYAFFNVMSKNGLCMWISVYPFVQNDIFLKVPYVLWIWDFVDMYLTHPGIRIWSPSIHTYYKKWFFGPLKLCCTQLYFSTLNLIILQMVWNECIRFGGHIYIQVSYRILQLEVQKKSPILHNMLCF